MFQKIDPKALQQNVFSLLGDQWALVTAGNADQCNTMTISWGGLGVMWGVPMATVMIRPQRYTKEFIDREDYLSLSFFSEQYRKQLSFCGKESGRKVDKIKQCGFKVDTGLGGTPYMREADLVLVCKKRSSQLLDGKSVPRDVVKQWYPNKDFHEMYFCEVVEVLQKK